MTRIESLLSARLWLVPQFCDDKIYFISDISGRLSLYRMDHGGSIPQPLISPHIALQNPHHIQGELFYVFPKLSKILLMLDMDGDENYQPVFIALDGGFPEPALGKDYSEDFRFSCLKCYPEDNLAYLVAESHKESVISTWQANLETGEIKDLGHSPYGNLFAGDSEDHTRIFLADGYTPGDVVFFEWDQGAGERKLFFGKPIDQREPGETIKPLAIINWHLVDDDRALLAASNYFEDTGGFAYVPVDNPAAWEPVKVEGLRHSGAGELENLDHLEGDEYLLLYNIDGVSWLYCATYKSDARLLKAHTVLAGAGDIGNGVLEHHSYDKTTGRHIFSYSTATSPTQIYSFEGGKVIRHTNERLLGIPMGQLSGGEDASFTSHDGLRISARLYLPDKSLGYKGPRPLVYYIHGGPQGQERPDFAWFSMPLIQFLTLKGFAVFVPNVRGSTGYGLEYMKHVDKDWGGQDRLDHVHAMTEVLPGDTRIDTLRTAVMGRSYGGYMTLMLSGRHPELWKAAVDMFGPYDLISFSQRIPETWKPYFEIALGHPEKDLDFLNERSPKTYLDNLASPMLVIQGRNDPRVVEAESSDLVEELRGKGKEIDYIVFEDEGHDVLKFPNKVKCYNAITDFFVKHLQP